MATLRTLLARVRGLDSLRMDGLLAVLVLAEGLLELALVPIDGPDRARGIVWLLAVCVGIVVRRRTPLLAVAVAFAGMIVGLQSSTCADQLTGPNFAILLVVLGAAMATEGRRLAALWTLSAGLAVLAVFTDAIDDGGTVNDLAWALGLTVAVPMVAGRLLRGRSELNRTLREKAERLEADRETRAAHAVAQERARIAEELHDVVAHALSGMVVQATAARRLVDAEPDGARDAFAAVERSGREALDEMRRLLGVLRRDDELALAPQPSLAHLSVLLRRAREAGLPVQLQVDGAATPLAHGVDLAAYRVVQEAISEALAQGDASHATVHVRYGPELVELEVLDDGTAPEGGRALLGMRERVTVYGGELRAGGGRDCGHAVRARIPIGGTA